MFFLTYGEKGPRAVLVQTLLRLKGINVTINGIWDQQCHKAVVEYREKLNLNPLGPVDGKVFFNLLQDSKLKVVDSMDASAGYPTVIKNQDMVKAGIKPLLNEHISGKGVANAVNKIIVRAQSHRIGLLRIFGHGNRGTWICMAVGDPVHTRASGDEAGYRKMEADYKSYIDYSHFESHRKILTSLKHLFASFGSAEVHGCRLGNQRKLLEKLADTWGVPVTGGLTNQWGGSQYNYKNSWGQIVPATFAFEGEVFTAYPNGKDLQSWAADIEASIPNLIKWVSQFQQSLPNLFGKQ